MQILNTTTNKIETLIYAPTGCNCIADLIADDSSITWTETNTMDAIRAASEEAIDFWRGWIATAEAADALENELAEKIGDKHAAAQISIDACDGVEFNDQPGSRIEALTKALADHDNMTDTAED